MSLHEAIHVKASAPKGWWQRDFEINCRNYPMTVSGYTRGHMGIHHDGYVWTITHLPSGFRIIHFDGAIGRAVRVANALLKMHSWCFVTSDQARAAFPDIGSRARALLRDMGVAA